MKYLMYGIILAIFLVTISFVFGYNINILRNDTLIVSDSISYDGQGHLIIKNLGFNTSQYFNSPLIRYDISTQAFSYFGQNGSCGQNCQITNYNKFSTYKAYDNSIGIGIFLNAKNYPCTANDKLNRYSDVLGYWILQTLALNPGCTAGNSLESRGWAFINSTYNIIGYMSSTSEWFGYYNTTSASFIYLTTPGDYADLICQPINPDSNTLIYMNHEIIYPNWTVATHLENTNIGSYFGQIDKCYYKKDGSFGYLILNGSGSGSNHGIYRMNNMSNFNQLTDVRNFDTSCSDALSLPQSKYYNLACSDIDNECIVVGSYNNAQNSLMIKINSTSCFLYNTSSINTELYDIAYNKDDGNYYIIGNNTFFSLSLANTISSQSSNNEVFYQPFQSSITSNASTLTNTYNTENSQYNLTMNISGTGFMSYECNANASMVGNVGSLFDFSIPADFQGWQGNIFGIKDGMLNVNSTIPQYIIMLPKKSSIISFDNKPDITQTNYSLLSLGFQFNSNVLRFVAIENNITSGQSCVYLQNNTVVKGIMLWCDTNFNFPQTTYKIIIDTENKRITIHSNNSIISHDSKPFPFLINLDTYNSILLWSYSGNNLIPYIRMVEPIVLPSDIVSVGITNFQCSYDTEGVKHIIVYNMPDLDYEFNNFIEFDPQITLQRDTIGNPIIPQNNVTGLFSPGIQFSDNQKLWIAIIVMGVTLIIGIILMIFSGVVTSIVSGLIVTIELLELIAFSIAGYIPAWIITVIGLISGTILYFIIRKVLIGSHNEG